MLAVTSPLPSASSGALLAQQYGLRKVGGRPALRRYVVDVWERRHFALGLARGRAWMDNQEGYLGQLWAFITPLLWALLYYFVFGILLPGVHKGIPNFAAYLVAGLFIFRYVAQAMQTAAKCIMAQTNLITSLQFPRALIPLAYATAETIALLPALIILLAVCLLTGEPLRWNVLLLVPTMLMCWVFTTGVSLIIARFCYEARDTANLIPFFNRLLMYVSGVMFALDRYGDGWFGYVARHQPLALYIQLTRECLLAGTHVPVTDWIWGLGWAVGFLVVGFVYFWHAEAKYGRG